MGNSEVGHLNIGAGRVVYQDFTRIDRAIETGEFARNPALAGAIATARRERRRCTCWACVSPGGVHSHERQIAAMVEMAARRRRAARARARVSRRPRHAAAERRGVAAHFIDRVCAAHPGCRIADIVGRYYAMDRDQRWDRVAAGVRPDRRRRRAVSRAATRRPRWPPPTRAARTTSSSSRPRSSASRAYPRDATTATSSCS